MHAAGDDAVRGAVQSTGHGTGFWDRVLAHGIGGARDLPLPLGLTIAGAVVALVVSFTVLAVAWRTPRYDDDPVAGRPAPAWLAHLVGATWFVVLLRVLGMAMFAYTVLVAVLGEDTLINPFFGIFYVLLWVGLVPLSVLVGPVWKAISPFRTITWLIARSTGGDPHQGIRAYPSRLGLWPAALGLYAFVWLELVYPYATEQDPVRLWCTVYVAVMLVGGQVYGERFFASADPFEVYSSLVAKLSFWARAGDRPDGRLIVRSPLANLSTVPVGPGLVAVVCVLFGSTAFDSFRDSVHWIRVTQGDNVLTHVSIFFANNVGLLGFCLAVTVVFALGTMATGVGPDQPRRALPGQFAHSVVPIVVGYVLAHYLSYLVLVGQQTVIQMSDPLSNGSNWFGTANLPINYFFAYHPTALASVKVLFVVIGHILGVVAAHDRAIQLLPRQHQITGQLTLLATMIVFTGGGLYLLFSA